jgi:hypothetical protein
MSLLGEEAGVSHVLALPDIAAIRRELENTRPDLGQSSNAIRTAVLLLVGPSLNFNIDRMTGRTRFPRPFVAACTRRLFDNGVWEHAGPVYLWDSAADDAFWRDVAVGEGKMQRRRTQGGIEWAEPGVWKKEYVAATEVIAPLVINYASEVDKRGVAAVQQEIERLPVKPKSIFETTTPRPLGRSRRTVAPSAVEETSPEALVLTNSADERPRTRDLFPEANWL